jgi:hypothetical protein
LKILKLVTFSGYTNSSGFNLSGGSMKVKTMFLALLVIAVLFSACQAAQNPSADTQKQSEQAKAYPNSDLPTPAENLPAVLYPDAKDGDIVTFRQIVAMIKNGEVTKVIQTHDLKVFATLKDGRVLSAVEPQIDDVINAIKTCGDPCKNIRIATE